jgi:hypothetical protein
MKKPSLFVLVLMGTLFIQSISLANGRRGGTAYLDAMTRARVQVINAEARVLEAKMTRSVEIYNGKVEYSFYESTNSSIRISVGGNKITELVDYLQKEYGKNNVKLEPGLLSTTIAISKEALDLRGTPDSIALFNQVDSIIKRF